MKEIPEAKIQQEIYQYFNNNYCLKHHKPSYIIHSVPNGLPIHTPEKARILDMLHKTGMVNGISDMIIHGREGKCICVEVKTEIGTQSEVQKYIQEKVTALGGVYLLVRSLDDFKKQIHNLLTNNNL